MAWRHDTMMNPPIEELFERADSKFRLVTLASKRARQINSYFNQLGEGLGATVPPQVTSVARKPLSIAFEEIAADKIVPVEPHEPTEEELAAIAQAEADAAEAEAPEADTEPPA
jgi:DNA-directed RNA polymerase subunit omega